jgi:hypothetical protein
MMVKQNLELHQLSIANFVDLNETNKKVIEGNLPRSLLGDIRSTQRSKIALKKALFHPLCSWSLSVPVTLYAQF